MGLELVRMPKFTQQIRRYYSIDTLIHKDILHIYHALCLSSSHAALLILFMALSMCGIGIL